MAYSLSGSSAKALKRFARTLSSPRRKPRIDVLPFSEPLGKITPWRAGAKLPDHRFNEQPIVQFAVAPDTARTTRKQTLNPRELIVAQSISPHRKPSKMKALYESRFKRFANPPSSI
jgi:hypothetical protein